MVQLRTAAGQGSLEVRGHVIHSFSLSRSVFARIAPLPNLKALRSELNVFMKHFLLRRSGSDKDDLLINKRITLAEHAMRTES